MHPGIEANELPTITGKVVHGDKVGRTMGFPTANLDVQLDPVDVRPGVYTATVTLRPDETPYHALAYFGPRYVLGEHKNNFEVYVMNFNNDLYGQMITVTLLAHRREPMPFTDLGSLQKQLELDKLDAVEYFNTHH